jgi:hypothetical protein
MFHQDRLPQREFGPFAIQAGQRGAETGPGDQEVTIYKTPVASSPRVYGPVLTPVHAKILKKIFQTLDYDLDIGKNVGNS